jgi:hypothetical protein
MRPKIYLTALFLVLTQHLYSQYDSLYIAKFKQKFGIQVYTTYSFTSLRHTNALGEQQIYLSNAPAGIGLGIMWRGSGLYLSYGFDFLRDKRRGKTHSFDFQYHYYDRHFILDLFGQNYRGFYTVGDEGYIIRPDIRLSIWGASFQYSFNDRRFSHSATFGQTELQLKPAGGFLLGAGFYYTTTGVDNPLTENELLAEHKLLFGPIAGYSYNWVIKRYYLSTVLSAGINLGLENIDKKLNAYPILFPRFSAGYNADKWSVGLSLVYNSIYVKYSKQTKLSHDTGNVQVRYIYRFNFKAPKLAKFIPLRKLSRDLR